MSITSRSRLDRAVAQMDAAIAELHAHCQREQMVAAHAPHHLGCMLADSHEGDCVIRRPPRPRYTIVGLAILALAILVGGCAGRSDREHDVVDSARYRGSFGSVAQVCPNGEHRLAAHCEVDEDEGYVSESLAQGQNGWSCTVHPFDTELGAELTLHLECAP